MSARWVVVRVQFGGFAVRDAAGELRPAGSYAAARAAALTANVAEYGARVVRFAGDRRGWTR